MSSIKQSYSQSSTKKPDRRRRKSQESWIASVLERQKPAFRTFLVPEPRLRFASNGTAEDPKTGIALYGPLAKDLGPRTSLRIGLIGTSETISAVRDQLSRMGSRIVPGLNSRRQPYDLRLAPDFPGIGSEGPFECDLELAERMVKPIASLPLGRALSEARPDRRIHNVVELFSEQLQVLADGEPQPDVVICAVPKEAEDTCRHQAHKKGRRIKSPHEKAEERWRRRSERDGQALLDFGNQGSEEDAADESAWDFHNCLKARAMRFGLPTQLIWDSTLRGSTVQQDAATIAWNLAVAIYYKAGNVPWSIEGLPANTCFIGLAFYKEAREPDSTMRTALAQVFSQGGDGLVLRGERGIVDEQGDKRPHLTRESAERVVRRAIELYSQHYGQRPGRIVIHKTSRYSEEERDGFLQGLGDIGAYDFVALERRGLRFFRVGQEPPIRGTVVELARRNYVLFTSGYVPHLGMYPGPRIPFPLEILEHHGDSSSFKVCQEILALTKLNWNSAAFYSRDPITIAFSRQVGSILRDLEDGTLPNSKYRFYM